MSSADHRADDPSRVGASFVKGYYVQLSSDPKALANYYAKDSCFTVIDSPSSLEQPHVVHGAQDIMDKLAQLGFRDVKTRLTSVVCQPSTQGGVLVVTVGAVVGDDQFRDFTHVFVLAKKKEKQFFIQNECLYLSSPAEPDQEPEQAELEPEPAAEPESDQQSEPEPQPEGPAKVATGTATVEAASSSWADEDEQPNSNSWANQSWDAPAEPVAPQAHPEPAANRASAASVAASVPTPEPAPVSKQEPRPKPSATPAHQAPVAAPAAPPAAPTRSGEEPERQTFADVLKKGATPSAPWGVVRATATTVQAGISKPPAAAAPKRQHVTVPKPRPTVGSKSPSVYVARVPVGTNEEQLIEEFSKFGQVVQVRNREAKRIAFVDFATDESVLKAIAAAKDGLVVIKGQALVVQAQKEKDEITQLPRAVPSAEEEDPAYPTRRSGRGTDFDKTRGVARGRGRRGA